MTVYFSGYVFQDDGDALNGATVQLLQVSDAAEEASTTTDSNGFWSFNEADEDQYDVKITSGTSVRYRKWADEISLKMLDVRNNEGNTVPAAVFANHTNNADNDIVHYRGLRGTGADNDEMFFRYYMDDASSNTTEVARMTVKLISASAASEDSEIRWGVAVGGSIVDVLTISNTSSGATDMTMDVAGDINLDADGGDVFFKDGGTTFGSATNNSGNLILKSGTTTAATFSGANVTFAGTVDATTDFTVGNTVITDGVITDSTGLALTANVTLTDGSYNLNIASHDGTNGLALAGTVVTTTAAELNLIDGDTARGTTAVASGDGILINDGGTMRMTNVDTVSTYFSSHNVGGGNIVTTGALDSGSITSGFGNIDNGSSTITTTGAVDFGAATVDSLSVSDANITNVADIALDSISADGTDINVAVSDNSATALTIKQGSDAYLIVDTANSSESVAIGTGISGTAISIGHSTSETTINDNLTVTGTLTGTSLALSANLTLADNDKIIVGTGGDLEIYHNVSHSIIADVGTGNLQLRANDFRATNSDNSATYISGNNGAEVKLYYDNSKKFETTNTGVKVSNGSLETATIDYTDGDLAMTIADGGGVTFAQAVALGSNTLTTTGKIFARSLDYDGSNNCFTIDSSGNMLASNRIIVGSSGNGRDLQLYGATSGVLFHWDASDDRLEYSRTDSSPILQMNRDQDTSATNTNMQIQSYHDESGTAKFAGAYTIDTSALNTGHGRVRLRVGNDDLGGGAIDFNALIAESDGGITIGGGIAHDTRIIWDGNGTDYYMGIENANDRLQIGNGSTAGSSLGISMNTGGNVCVGNGGASPNNSTTLRVDGDQTSQYPRGLAVGLATNVLTMNTDGGNVAHLQVYPGDTVINANCTASAVYTAAFYHPDIDVTADSAVVTDSVTVYIANASIEASNNYALVVDSGYSRFDGHVGIGDTIPSEAELVIRNADNAAHTLIYTSDSGTGNHSHWDIRNGGDTQVGTVNTNGSTTTYNTSSDYRLKENIVNLTGAIDRVKELKPKRFNFKADATVTLDGFLAHEAAEVVPISATGTKDEMDGSDPVYQGMDASKLVPLLTAAIKELDSRVTALE